MTQLTLTSPEPSPTFQRIRSKQAEYGCSCPISEESTYRDLLEMGAGCTAGGGFRAGYVCPALSHARELLKRREG